MLYFGYIKSRKCILLMFSHEREDFLFWKLMEESDIWDFVSEEDIFEVLNKNI